MAARCSCLEYSAFLFMLLYTFVLFKPAFPYIEYMINKGYIIAYLCDSRGEPENTCNGKCHLEKQVKKEVEASEEKDVLPPFRNDREEFQEYLISALPERQDLSINDLFIIMDYERYSYQYVPYIFHPPIRCFSLS